MRTLNNQALTSSPVTNSEAVGLFAQMLSSATREASIAMSRWVGSVVDLSLEEVRAVPLPDVATTLGLEAVPSVLVIVSLRPPLSGDIILHFDEENARGLARQLVGRPLKNKAGFNELEQSALLETGNILGCAYVNALSRMINHELIPVAPWLVCDFAESVIEQALIQQAERSDYVIISRTRFRRDDGDLNWFVLFLPGPSLQKAMEHSLQASSPHLK